MNKSKIPHAIITCLLILFFTEFYEYMNLITDTPEYNAFMHDLWCKLEGASFGFGATVLYVIRITRRSYEQQ